MQNSLYIITVFHSHSVMWVFLQFDMINTVVTEVFEILVICRNTSIYVKLFSMTPKLVGETQEILYLYILFLFSFCSCVHPVEALHKVHQISNKLVILICVPWQTLRDQNKMNRKGTEGLYNTVVVKQKRVIVYFHSSCFRKNHGGSTRRKEKVRLIH